MPVCGNYLFFELPKKIVLNPKDGQGFRVGFDPAYFGFGSRCTASDADVVGNQRRLVGVAGC